MTIDRVATNNQTSYMLAQINKANIALQQSNAQVSTGKIATDYSGIGDKTAALEGAKAAADRASGYQANTQLAITQTDLQDTQLTALSGLASQLQKDIQTAVSNSDGTSLMTDAQSIFDQAKAILNATDSNGNYIYSGQTGDVQPFTATDLANLASAPTSTFFKNGSLKKTVEVGDGQTEQIGVLAKDVGKDLMDTLSQLYQLDGGTGTYSGKLTTTQTDALTTQLLPSVKTALTTLNSATAQNGNTYTNLKTAASNQESLSNLYTGFVSDIQDADMATALTKLSSNQTALQAVLTVTSKLNQVSLLNYLPAG